MLFIFHFKKPFFVWGVGGDVGSQCRNYKVWGTFCRPKCNGIFGEKGGQDTISIRFGEQKENNVKQHQAL